MWRKSYLFLPIWLSTDDRMTGFMCKVESVNLSEIIGLLMDDSELWEKNLKD